MKKLLTSIAFCAGLASTAALAYPNGTPNAAAGAHGRNAPSSSEATTGVIAGHPHANVGQFREAEAGPSYHGPHDRPQQRFYR